jgi:2-dehydro-3-deoxygluconokinase
MSRFISMGEVMIRLTPTPYFKFEQANSMLVFYGGSESNVAVSLAHFGVDSAFITKLPNNPFGRSAFNRLRSYGLNINNIVFGGDRIGVNYYEIGTSVRPSRVVYDRANSAISEADVSDFDFDKIFKDAEWFHTTGITAALSDKSAILIEEALKKAKEYGLIVSMDLNYREKLWSPERAQKVMINLMQYVDICIGNEEDAYKCLGFKPKDTDIIKGKLSIDGYKDIFLRMEKKYGFKYIATTLRESYSASDNGWSALVYDGNEFYHSKKYDIHIVDRGGGGDAFSAGLIYGLLNDNTIIESTEFAVAASALKQTILDEYNLVNLDEVKKIMGGDTSGRIQR